MYGCVDYRKKVVLDIGADVGSTADFFLQKGARKVFAVESEPKIYDQLVKNVDTILGAGKVVPIHMAVQTPEHFEQLLTRANPDITKLDVNGKGRECSHVEHLLCKVDPHRLKCCNEWLIEMHGNTLKDITMTCMGSIGFHMRRLAQRVGYFKLE